VVAVLAVVCAALWLALAARVRWRGARRPRSFEIQQPRHPVAVDDGPVPEPIRLALLRRSRLVDAAVLNAAVLELAEAGLFHIEPADSQRPAMVSPNVLPHASTLPAYQASVVARLLHRRGAGRQPVPLTALQPGEDETSARWHKEFSKQVRQAATERGLSQPPAHGLQLLGLPALGIAASSLIASMIANRVHSSGLPILSFFLLCAAVIAVTVWVCQVRPTAAGRALLAKTERPEVAPTRVIAATSESSPATPVPAAAPAAEPAPAPPAAATPATPMPPVTAPITVLPSQLQPLPANQVWSDYGGSWHPLDIESKETYSINAGIPAFFVLFLFGILSVVGVVFARRDGDPSGAVPFTVFGALPIILLVGAAASLLRRRRLPKRAVLRGQIAKLWTVTQRGSESSTTYYYCALDVGRAPESVRLKIHRTLYGRLRVGAEIEVLVNPRRRSIKDFRFVEAG
jgi:hypothetical protein